MKMSKQIQTVTKASGRTQTNAAGSGRPDVSGRAGRFPALIAIMAAFLLTIGGAFVVRANGRPAEEVRRQKCYASIEVQPGDSLWSIASKYRSAEYSSMYDYIDEVKEMNHIELDQITAGTTLMVAYYRTVE